MRQKEANPRKITGSLQSQNTATFFKTEEVKQKFLKFANAHKPNAASPIKGLIR